jgi:hypothetical protein
VGVVLVAGILLARRAMRLNVARALQYDRGKLGLLWIRGIS